ncbi:acetyltransferase [Salmonella enterica subsp. enterica serovar Shubra]|nr:acetyltransferase [Salmonella enterica subsp. enterica serovar Shubra]EHA9186714.1 acetyltransferase [Salmonella enterica subsp. enterica serovar Shubra]EHL9649227.1 acetyltransferase [Salmonella enterica]
MELHHSLPDVNPHETNPPVLFAWWKALERLPEDVRYTEHLPETGLRSPGIDIAASAVIDETDGPVRIGQGTRICHGAVLKGPLIVGRDCLIGNHSFLRGACILGNAVKIGFGTEVKNARIESGATIGPQCFIADSIVSRDAYLGAMVRTSNHRLDGKTVSVIHNNVLVDTGREKLGCFIGERACLGVQVIILPGRVVAPETRLAPRITVERNLPSGYYRLRQEIIQKEI